MPSRRAISDTRNRLSDDDQTPALPLGFAGVCDNLRLLMSMPAAVALMKRTVYGRWDPTVELFSSVNRRKRLLDKLAVAPSMTVERNSPAAQSASSFQQS